MSLFDPGERTDPRSRSHTEDSFSFLNRVNQPGWRALASELERWYADYPSDHAPDLRARFRSRDFQQHISAWWELYLHRLFMLLGFTVEVHPQVTGSSRRPDFLIRRHRKRAYVEAIVPLFADVPGGPGEAARRGVIFDAINRVRSDFFVVDVEIETTGPNTPRLRDITDRLSRWLDGLNPDEAEISRREELRMEANGWDLRFRAIPVPKHARGRDHQLIAIYPSLGGWTDYPGVIRKALQTKGNAYKVDEPLIIAILVSSFVDEEDVSSALFGSLALRINRSSDLPEEWVRRPDGYWLGHEWRNAQISALLLAAMLPWTFNRDLPTLWHHPAATSPVRTRLPFARRWIDSKGHLRQNPARTSPPQLFGLPPSWPFGR